MKTFRTTRKWMGPSWLTDGEGGLVGYALDLVKDASMKAFVLGLRARFPQDPADPTGQTTAPPDALAAIGRDRRMQRGIFETDVEYAARLPTWLDERKTAGNPFTLMRQLHAYTGTAHGCSFRTVDARGNWYSRAADGSQSAVLKAGNWNWDNRPTDDQGRTRWSRFWVVIYPGTLWGPSPFNWGDTAGPRWGGSSSSTLGSTATPEQIATLRALVLDWMGAGKRCVNIILAFDPATFDPASPEPDGLWEHWSKVVGGVRVPARLSTARYLDGVSS